MKQAVMLSLRGTQEYLEQEPDVISLITEGTLEDTPEGWLLTYEESSLTGMEGVTTQFLIQANSVILSRTGKLNSQMVFRLNEPHESLYQMEFGALMIKVCAKQITYDICQHGGVIDLSYNIEIENTAVGSVQYHMDIAQK